MARANPARMGNATEIIADSTTVRTIASLSTSPAISAGLVGLKVSAGRTAVAQVLPAAKARGATVHPAQMVQVDPWTQPGINALVTIVVMEIVVKEIAASSHAARSGRRCPADP